MGRKEGRVNMIIGLHDAEKEHLKYKVELAEFHTIEIEAESKEEAENKVAVMDDEDILKQSVEDTEMMIWQITEV